MEKLSNRIDKLGMTLNKRGDILAYDFPMLSHFYDHDGKNYFLLWTDCDDSYNRWLLFEVNYFDIYEYLNGEKSLLRLIKTSNEIKYFLDIDDKIDIKRVFVVDYKKIPPTYLPDDDTFFNENFSTPYSGHLRNESEKVFESLRIPSRVKQKLRKSKDNDYLYSIELIEDLSKTNIQNSFEEILALKASDVPLRILHDYYSESNSFKHLITKSKSAYVSPIELESYFVELDNLLALKVISNVIIKASQPQYSNYVLGRLASCARAISTNNPETYQSIFIRWENEVRSSFSEHQIKEVFEWGIDEQ